MSGAHSLKDCIWPKTLYSLCSQRFRRGCASGLVVSSSLLRGHNIQSTAAQHHAGVNGDGRFRFRYRGLRFVPPRLGFEPLGGSWRGRVFFVSLAQITFFRQSGGAASIKNLKENGQRMALVIFAVIGYFIGYRLEMTRAGYLTMALTAVGFSAGQIVHLLITRNREAMTMLPLVVGLILVLFMLFGAMVRLAIRHRTNAA
jgi:hypothetical protein